MTTTQDRAAPDRATPGAPPPDVEIVIPVYNEERALAASVDRLHAYLAASFPCSVRITIADNASSDNTLQIAQTLAGRLPGVRVVHLAEKGRGRALHQVWAASDATVLTYMDVDPSLAQFRAYVASGRIHYYLGGGVTGASNGGSTQTSQIAAWVEQHYTASTVDGVTVYDLTTPGTSAS